MKVITNKYLVLFLLFILINKKVVAQIPGSGTNDLIQFTGMVLTEEKGRLTPVPFATVAVKGTTRGTYANYKGFFSLVVRRGETIQFSSLGFRDHEKMIPDTLSGNKYAVVELLSADVINLPEFIVFPWPSREHLKQEFLALDVTNALADNAATNLAEDRMSSVRSSMRMDGRENGNLYLRQQAQRNYYIGQAPPMPIFNPMAWAQFFQSWKNGDFKDKRKK